MILLRYTTCRWIRQWEYGSLVICEYAVTCLSVLSISQILHGLYLVLLQYADDETGHRRLLMINHWAVVEQEYCISPRWVFGQHFENVDAKCRMVSLACALHLKAR